MMITMIMIKLFVLGNSLGVAGYASKYRTMNVVQEVWSYLYYVPEYLLCINVLLIGIFVIRASRLKCSEIRAYDLSFEVLLTYLTGCLLRCWIYSPATSYYFNFSTSFVKLAVLIMIACVTSIVAESNIVGVKHTYMLTLLMAPAYLALCSIDLFVTAFLLEILFTIVILWSLIDHSSSTIRGSIRYFIINSVGGGLFLFAASRYFLITGDSWYYIGKFIDFNDKIGIYCFIWSFIIKVGTFPFHYWNIDIINTFSNELLIMYIQVISKFILLLVYYKVFAVALSNRASYLLIGSGVLSMIVSVLSNPYQYRLKEFLSLSSIINIALIQILIGVGGRSANKLIIWYILTYSILSIVLWYYILVEAKILFISENSNLSSESKHIFSLYLLLIAGYPPSPIFILKILTFFIMYVSGLKMLTIIVLFLSVVNYLNYMRLVKIIIE